MSSVVKVLNNPVTSCADVSENVGEAKETKVIVLRSLPRYCKDERINGDDCYVVQSAEELFFLCKFAQYCNQLYDAHLSLKGFDFADELTDTPVWRHFSFLVNDGVICDVSAVDPEFHQDAESARSMCKAIPVGLSFLSADVVVNHDGSEWETELHQSVLLDGFDLSYHVVCMCAFFAYQYYCGETFSRLKLCLKGYQPDEIEELKRFVGASSYLSDWVVLY